MVLSILGVAWALIVPKLGGAVNAILNVVAITDMPVFVIICLGLFFKKINAMGALLAIILGTVAGTIASVNGFGGIQGLAFTTAASTITALVVGLIVSSMTKKTDAEQKDQQSFSSALNM